MGAFLSSREAARSADQHGRPRIRTCGRSKRSPVESTFTCTNPDPGESLVEANTWVSGSTQIDLRRAADRSGGLVNWKTEWRLELDPRNPRPLRIELDPGLELIDVQGPAVRGYRSERSGNATRLVVTLDSGLETSTELRILAHAQVPSEGEWTIPGLRPLDAIWTGGTTTVFLDEFHVMKECREKAGRLVFPSSPEFRSG